MCDFARLNDMVSGALPYVQEWARAPVHRDKLEVALAGVWLPWHLVSDQNTIWQS